EAPREGLCGPGELRLRRDRDLGHVVERRVPASEAVAGARQPAGRVVDHLDDLTAGPGLAHHLALIVDRALAPAPVGVLDGDDSTLVVVLVDPRPSVAAGDEGAVLVWLVAERHAVQAVVAVLLHAPALGVVGEVKAVAAAVGDAGEATGGVVDV